MEVLGAALIARSTWAITTVAWVITTYASSLSDYNFSSQFERLKLLLLISPIQVTPDESTGADYEQVARKYDSEDEFEILW